MKKFVFVMIPALALAACQGAASHGPDWAGKWTGPEGTYLVVNETEDGYRVAIRDLDAERTYKAVEKSGALSFRRNGRIETIRPGTGADTGMKWLRDKRDCLVINPGEGYCRN